MSSKLSVIVYILICFEVGILLMILPWTSYWDDNYFLDLLIGKLHAPVVAAVLHSGYTRGGVTGLGLLNLIAGFRDIFRFRESVSTLTSWEARSASPSPVSAVENSINAAANLPDHRPPSIPPQG